MKLEVLEPFYKSSGDVNVDASSPTLVIDAGMGNWSLFFQPLAQELRKFAKVCLISRDGYLDSMPKPALTDPFFIAHQLKRGLDDNKIRDNIILVGHSLGGLHARLFYHLFPSNILGLILLDSAHPQMFDVLPEARSNLKKQIRLVNILKILARVQLLWFAKRSIPTFGLPPALHELYFGVTTQSRYYKAYQAEMKRFESLLAICKQINDLGDLPLLIICSPCGLNIRIAESYETEQAEDEAWLGLQNDFTALSSQSTFVKSKGDHFVHLTDTTFVANTIRHFIERYFCNHLKLIG